MITTHGITKTIGHHMLWNDLETTINKGEMMAVRSRSGSGKSTLLNCLGLLEPLTAGGIMVGSAAPSDAKPSATCSRTVPSLKTAASRPTWTWPADPSGI